VKDLVWTASAESSFNTIAAYIEQSFGTESANRFRKSVTEKLKLLQLYPGLGYLETSRTKSMIVSRFSTVLYIEIENTIVLTRFVDHRKLKRKK
jgi:plasmid stabilization system protein ParE